MQEHKMPVPVRRPREWPYDFDQVREGMLVRLQREPENPVNPNAVAIYDLEGGKLGYMPAEMAVTFSPMLASGGASIQQAFVRELTPGSNWVTVTVEVVFTWDPTVVVSTTPVEIVVESDEDPEEDEQERTLNEILADQVLYDD